MATLTPTPQPIKIDPLSIKPVPCPGCGEIVGQQVEIEGIAYLENNGLYFPWIPMAIHRCGAIVYFGRHKRSITKRE